MKLLKNSIAVVILLVSTMSFAQDRELTEEQKDQVKQQLEQYFEKLDLSEEQQLKFEEITKRYVLQIKALKASNKRKFIKYREYKSIKRSKNRKMKTFLSDEQYKIYKETQIEIQKKMKEKRKNKN